MFDNFNDFKPIYFLDFSNELFLNMGSFDLNNSTIKRVIYGRIYYATFLYVREWLKENWGYRSSKRDHTQMINFLRSKGPFNNVMNNKIADDIALLKRLRHQVDYYIIVPEEGNDEYNNWVHESIEYAFELSNYVINSFNNVNV